MAGHVYPVLFVIAAWFVSTGVVIALDRLAARTFRWSLTGAGVVALGGLWVASHVAADSSPAGAYLGFGAALAVWGWHEMSFLMGVVTGPRTTPLPRGTTGWARFRMAAATLIWHEVAMAATAVVMLALTWRQPNQIAALTFAVLFVLRLSAKLNIFLGVPNLTVDFLPVQLAYLKSYFRVAHFNPLFPVSVAVTSVIAMLMAEHAALASDSAAPGLTMLTTLVALGVLEHWFLVLPVPDAALWRWAMTAKSGHAK